MVGALDPSLFAFCVYCQLVRECSPPYENCCISSGELFLLITVWLSASLFRKEWIRLTSAANSRNKEKTPGRHQTGALVLFRSGMHSLNEELGRHIIGREGKVECSICGAECESVVHVLLECQA